MTKVRLEEINGNIKEASNYHVHPPNFKALKLVIYDKNANFLDTIIVGRDRDLDSDPKKAEEIVDGLRILTLDYPFDLYLSAFRRVSKGIFEEFMEEKGTIKLRDSPIYEFYSKLRVGGKNPGFKALKLEKVK